MKKYIKLLLLVLCMSLIFYFSAQPSVESTIQTNVVVDILYKVYAYIFGSDRAGYEVFVGKWFTPTRKLAHFSEYALLGFLVYINLIEYINIRIIRWSIILSAIYAVSDEIHQFFVPGRYCAVKDMLIDTSGAIFGIFLIHLIRKRWKKD